MDRNVRLAAVFLVVLALGAAASVAIPGGDSERPNVIVIGIEATRADALSCYGYHRNTSPELCDLAEDGVLFEEAYSHGSWTPVALPSLLTGLPPNSVSLPTWNYTMNDNATIFTETLSRQANYSTTAASSSIVNWGINENHDFDLVLDGGAFRSPARTKLVQRMEMTPEQDAYWLFIDKFAHFPYAPSQEYRLWEDAPIDRESLETDYQKTTERRGQYALLEDVDNETLRALYDEEILQVDDRIGKFLDLLKAAGMYEDSLIVFTADHGQVFGTPNNLYGHAHSPYEQLIHVPLIMKFPGNRWAGTRVTQPVRHVDVTATVFDVVGVDADAPSIGTSLLPAITGTDLGLIPFAGQYPTLNWVIIDQGFRYLVTDTRATCSGTSTLDGHLVRTNMSLADEGIDDPGVIDGLEDELCRIYQSGLKHIFPPNDPVMTPETRERLEKLGYL